MDRIQQHVPALLSAVLAAPAADVVGTWPKGPIKLPGAKLPNVPLLGNGFLGVAFGSPIGGTSKTSSSAIGPNGSGALDMWLNIRIGLARCVWLATFGSRFRCASSAATGPEHGQ